MPPIERHPWILNINDWAALPLLMRTSITVPYDSKVNFSDRVMEGDCMTLRQEVEVHEIHAESDYDEDDEGPVAPGSQDGSLSQLLISRNRKEPFENLPRLHPSAL